MPSVEPKGKSQAADGHTLHQLAASSSLPNLIALVISRLADLQQLGIVPELTGSLAAPLLAASQSQEMPLP